MKIGFDAKRAFHNQTGLGNHARNLINGLHQYFPADELLVFNPKPTSAYQPFAESIREINPTGIGNLFPSLWRSRWQVADIKKHGVDIYHGLSHELPYGLEKTNIPSIVTMHDLLFEHLPEQYKANDRAIYRQKFKHACHVATHIIAISKATKHDLINLYQIEADKISVGSNVVDERFYHPLDASACELIRARYQLGTNYFLSVGSIIERKNLLGICEAFKQIQDTDTQLVVIGKGKAYKQQVLDYLKKHQLAHRVRFLEDLFPSVQLNEDLPAIYQLAKGLIYPSRLEGFGLPVAEAMAIGCPVITSNCSSLLEVGGAAALLVSPNDIEAMANAMHRLLHDESTRINCIQKGHQHAQQYTMEKAAQFVHAIYKNHIK